jgi:hypothetical protein
LETADLHARIKLYGLDQAFIEGLRTAAELIDGHVELICETFWKTLRSEQRVRRAYPDEVLPKLITRSVSITRRKFVGPVDQEWAELIAVQGELCTEHQIPGRLLIAALNACYEICLQQIFERSAGELDKIRQCASALQKLAAVEHDLVLTRVTVNHRRAELARLAKQTHLFRNHVLSAVESVANACTGVGRTRRALPAGAKALGIRAQIITHGRAFSAPPNPSSCCDASSIVAPASFASCTSRREEQEAGPSTRPISPGTERQIDSRNFASGSITPSGYR